MKTSLRLASMMFACTALAVGLGASSAANARPLDQSSKEITTNLGVAGHIADNLHATSPTSVGSVLQVDPNSPPAAGLLDHSSGASAIGQTSVMHSFDLTGAGLNAAAQSDSGGPSADMLR
jgi:hypothetical protein